jgi:hypothetical protein
MLVCRLEIWPRGDAESRRVIGTVVIARRPPPKGGELQDSAIRDYDVGICDDGNPPRIQGGVVRAFNHDIGPFRLLLEGIDAACEGRATKRAKELLAIANQDVTCCEPLPSVSKRERARSVCYAGKSDVVIEFPRRRKATLNATVPGNAVDARGE